MLFYSQTVGVTRPFPPDNILVALAKFDIEQSLDEKATIAVTLELANGEQVLR